MANYTWIGGSLGSWDEPSNWDINSVPGTEDIALIENSASITAVGNVYVAGLTVRGDVDVALVLNGGYVNLGTVNVGFEVSTSASHETSLTVINNDTGSSAIVNIGSLYVAQVDPDIAQVFLGGGAGGGSFAINQLFHGQAPGSQSTITLLSDTAITGDSGSSVIGGASSSSSFMIIDFSSAHSSNPFVQIQGPGVTLDGPDGDATESDPPTATGIIVKAGTLGLYGSGIIPYSASTSSMIRILEGAMLAGNGTAEAKHVVQDSGSKVRADGNLTVVAQTGGAASVPEIAVTSGGMSIWRPWDYSSNADLVSRVGDALTNQKGTLPGVVNGTISHAEPWLIIQDQGLNSPFNGVSVGQRQALTTDQKTAAGLSSGHSWAFEVRRGDVTFDGDALYITPYPPGDGDDIIVYLVMDPS